MKKKHYNAGRAKSMPAGIGIGVLVSLVVTVMGAAIVAWMIVSERIGENGIGWGCMVILPVASAAGAEVAWRLIRHRRLMVCGIQCGAFYLLLLAMALPFGGVYEGMVLTALLVAIGGGISLIPGLIWSGNGGQHYRKTVFR